MGAFLFVGIILCGGIVMLDFSRFRNGGGVVVLGLDLAKDKTGFCMLEVGSYRDMERVRWLGSGVFVMPSKNDKWLFSGKEGLLRGIGSLVEDLQGQGKDVVCVLETPVFGGSRSEQQFYLNQEVLWLLKGYGVDVVGFNPLQLKGFVKGLIPEGAVELMPDRLNKGHLARVYEEWVRPWNEWLPRNKVEKGSDKGVGSYSDDELDAIYLCLMGVHFRPFGGYFAYMEDKVRRVMEEDEVSFIGFLNEFWCDGEAKGLLGVGCVGGGGGEYHLPLNVRYGSDDALGSFCVSLAKGGFFSFAGAGFYPFGRVGLLNLILRASLLCDVGSDAYKGAVSFFGKARISKKDIELFKGGLGELVLGNGVDKETKARVAEWVMLPLVARADVRYGVGSRGEIALAFKGYENMGESVECEVSGDGI